jgi:predicted GIY-YIG superfamily endonuclease
MPNYQNGQIYRLSCPTQEKVYIGSTTKLLKHRLANHRAAYNQYTRDLTPHVAVYDILADPLHKIELVEAFPCNTMEELLAREAHYIRNTPNLINKVIPGRTTKEWYDANKTLISNKTKEYYQQNKEAIKERMRTYYANMRTAAANDANDANDAFTVVFN